MFGIFSFLPFNNIFINRIVRAVLSPRFSTHGPRKLGPVLQNFGLSISRHGSRIQFINSKYLRVRNKAKVHSNPDTS